MAESPIQFSNSQVAAFYAARVPKVRQTGHEWRGPCPIHNGKDDNFAVDSETGQWFCHSVCGRGGDILSLEQALSGVDFKTAKLEIFRIVGRAERLNGHGGRRPPGQRCIVATYDYIDESGRLLYQAVRLDPKAFRQRKPDGNGGWAWNIKGIRLVLYRLPDLLKRSTERVFICEGEKDVYSLETLGLLATCNPMGAGKWRAQYSDTLRGRSVVVLPDNDEPGRKHAAAVAVALLVVAASVRVVELPGLSEKGDVTDWVDGGGTSEQLQELVQTVAPLDAKALSELQARWGIIDEPRKHQAEPVEVTDDWPEPEPIQSDLPPVDTFSQDLLPASFRPLVLDVADRMQVPMDYPAIVIVLCLAGVVNRRVVIQPKANDSSWVVVPNLWGGLIAPPGFMKSPVIHAATRPLIQIQADWRLDYENKLAEHAHAIEEWELRRSAWKELSKIELKKGNPALERPPDAPDPPFLRRLIVNDATFEAMHQTMNENPAGILVIRDELTGWLSQLDRVGREGERAFCLQAWNGDTGHTIDRIGRGTIQVDACCMSMLGGIQPGRLRSYLADALEDGPSNDGLIQRFQLLVWPSTEADWKYVDRAPDAAAEARVAEIFRGLVELDSVSPARFRFARDAQALFIEWQAELETKVRGDELHPALVSHVAKYRSLMPSLALLFELADRVGSVGFEGSSLINSENFVDLNHTKQAAAMCEYLESHARRMYSCVTTPQMRAAQILAERIKSRKIGADGFFSCRDVYLKGWSGLDTPEVVRLAVEVLQDACWIRGIDGETGPTGGRPSTRYQVNPKVWK